MAYFECVIGSGDSTEIPLTVTCTSGFAGETITCTDGTTTLTGTCPSSSPYTLVFHLPNAGTWNVSGNAGGTTYTESINADSFEVDLNDNITQTITLYSAANDTVSYTGLDGATHTITTNSSGEATATITINAHGSSITFTSSVAKDPDDQSSYFSKSITLTPSTSSIKIMPSDAVAYWYGYKISVTANYKLMSNYTNDGNAITFATNKATYNSNPSTSMHSRYTVFTTPIDLTSKTNLCYVVDDVLTKSAISLSGNRYIGASSVHAYSGGKNRYIEINNALGDSPTHNGFAVGESKSAIYAIYFE